MTTDVWATGFTPAHRADKKCGNSAIPDNRQCRVGARSSSGAVRRGLETAAIMGGATAFGGGLYSSFRQARRGNYRGAMRSLQVAGAGQTIAGAGFIAKGQRTKNSATLQIGGRLVGGGLFTTVSAAKSLGDFKRAGNAIRSGVSAKGLSDLGLTMRRGANAVRSRVAGIGYRRRSGPPRHSGYLPTAQAQPFDPRGRGRRGPWSQRGA